MKINEARGTRGTNALVKKRFPYANERQARGFTASVRVFAINLVRAHYGGLSLESDKSR